VDGRIRVIERKGPITMKELSGIEGVSVPTLTEWVGQRVAKGLLVWCDGEGKVFPDEASLNRAKHSGKAFIRLAYPCGLPTPFELTGDPRWEEGGEFMKCMIWGLEGTMIYPANRQKRRILRFL
jgi:DNA primase